MFVWDLLVQLLLNWSLDVVLCLFWQLEKVYSETGLLRVVLILLLWIYEGEENLAGSDNRGTFVEAWIWKNIFGRSISIFWCNLAGIVFTFSLWNNEPPFLLPPDAPCWLFWDRNLLEWADQINRIHNHSIYVKTIANIEGKC